MTTPADLTTPNMPSWCPGCGNFGIWAAFKNAAVKQSWDNTNTVITAGIGCHGHIVNFVKLTAFEGLHGRALPVASGVKMVNHRLNVFAFTGDGDCLSEGGNHFIHTCRRNHNITILLHNNDIYGLTTGQCSPTSPHDFKTGSTPQGNPDQPFNVLSLALASGATFVARGYSGDINGLADLIIKANDHQGVSVVEILQPCTTFDKTHTHTYFRENCYQLPPDYNPTNVNQAFSKAVEVDGTKLPLGIFYQVQKPTAESEFPQIAAHPLVDTPPSVRNISELFTKMR